VVGPKEKQEESDKPTREEMILAAIKDVRQDIEDLRKLVLEIRREQTQLR
jgi:DNA-binding protein YbaB